MAGWMTIMAGSAVVVLHGLRPDRQPAHASRPARRSQKFLSEPPGDGLGIDTSSRR